MALERNINGSASQTTSISLHHLCKLGDLLGVRCFVERGEDIDMVDKECCTPLYIACQEGHLAVVKYLVEQGAKDKAIQDGRTPLYIACQEGHLAVVQYLVAQGADKDQADQYGTSPLYIACQQGHLAVVQYLVEQGVNKDQAKQNGRTPLYIACHQGYLAIVQYLVEKGADKNQATKNGTTSLYIACYNGYLPVVQYLIEQGMDKAQAIQDGRTPLYIACAKGHFAVVQYLIEQGADNKDHTNNSWTPLLAAIKGNHIAITALLLAYGAKYTDELMRKDVVRNNAAVVELFAVAQTWPSPRNAYLRLMCGLDWLACYFKQQNSHDETIFFESWRKQFKRGLTCLTTLLVLATTRTVENEPRYSRCGLHRLPLEVLFYLIHQGALLDCPDSHLPLASATVNLNLPEYQLQACRLMGFWSIPATQRVLPDVEEERKIEEIDDDEADAIQAAIQDNARDLKIDARPQLRAPGAPGFIPLALAAAKGAVTKGAAPVTAVGAR